MPDTDKDILERALERYSQHVDAESILRKDMADDLRFEAGEQWPEKLRRDRETDPNGPRPCLVTNRVRHHVRNITNDIRQNRPSIKTLPVDDVADPEVAKMLNGLLRHIQVRSDAHIAYDNATDWQVKVGTGYFRLMTYTLDPRSKDRMQDIGIRPIANAFSVRMDYEATHPAGADARWCFVDEEVGRKRAEAMYGKDKPLTDFKPEDQKMTQWFPTHDVVRRAEYWEVTEGPLENYLTIGDGVELRESDYWNLYQRDENRPRVVSTRRVRPRVVMVYKMLGDRIVERYEFPAEHIGIIRVLGEERYVDGRRDIRGIVRDAKDPARMYNYWLSANTERMALAPKAPWTGPAEAFEGYEDDWSASNRQNVPYLPYKHVDDMGNPIPAPSRQFPAGPDAGLIQGMHQAADDIKAVTGQFDASLGNQSNETSGRAIMARQRQGDVANFHYVDHLTTAIKHAGRVILEMIPRIYDAPRVGRILGEDDEASSVRINPDQGRALVTIERVNGSVERIFNPTIGKYDVVVSVGPSYATKRQEAFEAMTDIIQGNPGLFEVIGDQVVKSMDWPGAEEMAERLRALLPPEVKAVADARDQGSNEAAMAAQQAEEALLAQIEPEYMQMQETVDMAASALEERDATIAQLTAQLEDKSAELSIKAQAVEVDAQEAVFKHESDMAGHETKLMLKAMDQQGASVEPPAETPPAVNGDDTAAQFSHLIAMQASAQTSARVEQMHEMMAEQVRRLAEIVAQGQAGQQQAQQEITELQRTVAAEQARRSRIQAAALEVLRNPDDSGALERVAEEVMH